MKDTYIFDLDGTLALFKETNHRMPYGFEADLILQDVVNESVATTLRALRAFGFKIILLSGREDYCKPQTIKWLEENKICFDELYMRKTNDNRKDSIVKQEIYNEQIKPQYNVIAIFDDRDQVVEMWRELGLTCFQVAKGDF